MSTPYSLAARQILRKGALSKVFSIPILLVSILVGIILEPSRECDAHFLSLILSLFLPDGELRKESILHSLKNPLVRLSTLHNMFKRSPVSNFSEVPYNCAGIA